MAPNSWRASRLCAQTQHVTTCCAVAPREAFATALLASVVGCVNTKLMFTVPAGVAYSISFWHVCMLLVSQQIIGQVTDA